MSGNKMKTISLYTSDLERIERLVDSGFCLSPRDAVHKALDALEADIEELLRREVVPVCDELDAHPEHSLSAKELSASVYEYHEAWMRKEAKRHTRQ